MFNVTLMELVTVYILASGINICSNTNVMVSVHNDRCLFKTCFNVPLASVKSFFRGRKKISALLKNLIGRGQAALEKIYKGFFCLKDTV